MNPTIESYLKQCAEWATGLREKYRLDLFFRTTVHIVVLQAVLVIACIGGAFFFLWYAPVVGGYAFAGIVLFAIVVGILLARFTLAPARDTLRYQKLFISNVAHELRTPLSTIKTSTEVALLDKSLSSPMRRVLGDITGELDRVSEIINNLLSLNTLTRPERMQFHNVDLGPLVSEIVQNHQSLARERDIKIVVQKDRYRTVWGNGTALEQVITNLLKNAISYTPKNAGGTVTVSIRPDYNGMVLFSVSDTGIGIAQEDLLHIFEPFYRADMSRVRRVKKGGSGLGLTIVNEIVRVHHGRIVVESTPRKGTTVSVFLPMGSERASKNGEHEGDKGRRSEISVDFSKHGYAMPQPTGPSIKRVSG